MGNDLLKDELKELQLAYKEILISASENIFKDGSAAVIDEINVFWHRNKKLVHCILKNLCDSYQAYVFTGATILDMADFEHYPFVTLGKYHFWDDPIYKYAALIGKTKNASFDKKIREQIIATINDNIKILNEAADIIYILPIRLLSEVDAQMVHDAGIKAFLSLFKEKIDFEHYQKYFNTIEDIKNGLCPGVDKSLIFSSDDDNTLDLETRFNNYKKTNALPLPPTASDAEVFWFSIYANMRQAFDTILMCAEYQLIPYIRFDVAYTYILSLSVNFGDNKEIKDMIFKCAIAHVIYRTFDKEKVKNLDFREYYHSIQKYDLEHNLFLDLEDENITFSNPSIVKIVNIIEKNFESFFYYIKK
ncbi:hypothetical protein [Pelosinus sp. sgz500959]|uniref:hypothetical protein n=1 Tax=Pelosinus sp. sgz500959 TaxID=3242472 RepID=UPI00366FDE1E